ncbi:MAG: hypothetical protein KGI98_16420 [Euryarchaeota archaeon]|nr:hypothetical protein [Euryarchaeota archaeon]
MTTKSANKATNAEHANVLAGSTCLRVEGFQECPWCGSTDPAHDPAPCARAEFREDRRALEGW